MPIARAFPTLPSLLASGLCLLLALSTGTHALRAQATAPAIASWIAFNTPPGTEAESAGALAAVLPGWTADRWGNLALRVGSGTPRRVVACAMDQSAYVVSQITDDGYLRLRRTGSARHRLWDQFHEAQRVTIFSAAGHHAGVVAVPNGHFARQHRADSLALTWDDLWVDIGASSRDDVRNLGVALLDPVAADRPAWSFAGMASGPGAGARAGCAAVVAAATTARAEGVQSGETIFMLTTQRIFGWVGLSTALVSLPPIDRLALVTNGTGPGQAATLAATRLTRDFRALRSRVGADSVDLYSPPVRYAGTLVESIHADDATALLRWVGDRAQLRSTPRYTALPDAFGANPAPISDAHEALATQFMQLADLPGVPGHEGPVRAAILEAMPAWAREQATVDTAGNIILAMGPDRDAIAFLAHMDEVAFEVQEILPDGRVTLRRLGGVVTPSWEGVPALLHFDAAEGAAARPSLRGVFVPRATGQTKVPPQLTAWFGMDSAQLVQQGVVPGLGITAYKRAARLAGTRVTARASDDRTGSAALLTALAEIDPSTLDHRVYFVWTVREEGGLFGARAFGNTFGASLRYVYSIDTFVSSETPLESPHFAYTPLGAGPVLRGLDDGSMVPRADRTRILSLARDAGIQIQVGTTQGSTDGSAVVPWGPPNIGLSWPGRYSHGPAEVLDLDDVAELVRLIVVVATAP